MHCANCEDEIGEEDTRYESVTPIQGGGQTRDAYCSVQCLNADVGFSDEEVESLMRQAGYEVLSEDDHEWAGYLGSNVDEVLMHGGDEGEFYILLKHVEQNFDIEIYHDPSEKLYEVVLYTYSVTDEGEERGLIEIEKKYTGVFQRALAYAENKMEMVEEGNVEAKTSAGD